MRFYDAAVEAISPQLMSPWLLFSPHPRFLSRPPHRVGNFHGYQLRKLFSISGKIYKFFTHST